jgi:hypothetical protein
MSDHHIQLGLFVAAAVGCGVGLITFGVLVWYAMETYKLRKAAEEQVKISQDVINAAMDQVEGLSKPCLAFLGVLRDGADTILDMHGATGNITAAAYDGRYVIQNIGNGVALNVQYHFPRLSDDPARPRSFRYIPNLMATEKRTLVETLTGYNQIHEVILDYESIGGRRYRSTLVLNHNVITSFLFEEIKQSTHPDPEMEDSRVPHSSQLLA